MSLIINGHQLTEGQAIRFHAELESREGEYFPSSGEVSTPPSRLVSRDAVSGCASMECEVTT